jgi:hypothetical protein
VTALDIQKVEWDPTIDAALFAKPAPPAPAPAPAKK